jgi:FkbM family methyltransferase
MKAPTRHEALTLLESLQSRQPAAPPVLSGAPIILYGAGELGKLAAGFFRHVNIPVSFAMDKKANLHLLKDYGIPVVARTNPADHADKVLLVSTLSEPYGQIASDLRNRGWQTVFPFYDYAQNFKDLHPLNNGWFSGCLSSEDVAGISGVIAKLADSHSIGAYLQFITWRLLREDLLYDDAPVIFENRYFIPQITQAITDRETYLDVGAYDGRVLQSLLKLTGGEITAAIMIEPDTINMALLKKTVLLLPRTLHRKIRLLTVVASDKTGRTSFSHGFDFASREGLIAATALPSIALDDLNLAPTFIKIHAEGSDLAVLQGARATMVGTRPKIAVTIYHNRDGLWKIPAYLISVLDGYVFYFREHSWCGTGAVFYAIPRKRK